MKVLSPIFIFICILSCSIDDTEESNMRVDHFLETGYGVGPTLVMRVQEGRDIGSGNWTYHYGGIEGFDYEWGYTYDLKVKKEFVKNPPADGSSIRYILEEVALKQMVSEEFEIYLKRSSHGDSFVYFDDGQSEYSLMEGISIDCSSLCDELEKILTLNEAVIGSFDHNESGGIILKQLRAETSQ